jgi:hypothetical protein
LLKKTTHKKHLFFHLYSGNHDIVFTSNRSTRFAEFYKETKYDLLLNDNNARQTFLKGNCIYKILLQHIFLLGGYYSIRHQTLKDNNQINLRFIVLNTVMFQPQHVDQFDLNDPIEQIEYVIKDLI